MDEIRHKWTYEDVIHANAVLDMASDMNAALDGLHEIEKKRGGE